MLNSQKPPVEYGTDGHLRIASVVKTNPFVLTLFTRVSDHGVLYSPPANYRSAMTELLIDRETHKLSLLDQVYTDNDGVFNSNPMNIMFFQEKPDYAVFNPGNTMDLKPCFMNSCGKETLHLGNITVKEVKLQFKKIAVLPSQQQLLCLAYIMNVKIS
jgi:hypothetical protein